MFSSFELIKIEKKYKFLISLKSRDKSSSFLYFLFFISSKIKLNKVIITLFAPKIFNKSFCSFSPKHIGILFNNSKKRYLALCSYPNLFVIIFEISSLFIINLKNVIKS